MPIMYKCSAKGCSKILEVQGLCPMHQDKYDKANKIRYKVYTTERLMDEEQKKYHIFYNTNDWKRIRDSLIASYYAMDIVEYYRTGLVVNGYTVHHVICLEDNYDLRLNVDNLIYLTESNHQYIHKEYNKGEREKKAMQKILMELKKKFNEEFKI